MNYLAEIGRPVTFLKWMIQGYPIGLLVIVLVSLWITFVHKPEDISDAAMREAEKMVHGAGPLTAREKKALAVIAAMFVAWIASSWVPVLNTTCVALMGTCLFMFPGIEVLSWQEYSQKGGWDATFMVGSVGALADATLATGAAKWLITVTLGGATSWPAFAIFLLISFLVCCIHILIPSGPAVAGLAVVPIVELAVLAKINPAGSAILVSFWSAVTFVLPTDAVPMFTYKFKYYSFSDMIKTGVPASIFVAVLVAILIPGACALLGC
jgi:sodium-dependent dicarboxylate transporter 2/3/5